MQTARSLRLQADLGDPRELFRLGYRLAFGRTRPRPTEWHTIVPLWEQAARAEHDRALFYLGTCHEFGYGVPQSLTLALEYYERAARLGNVVAMYNLALSYREGDGVAQDDERMLFWYVKAEKLGDARFSAGLGLVLP